MSVGWLPAGHRRSLLSPSFQRIRILRGRIKIKGKKRVNYLKKATARSPLVAYSIKNLPPLSKTIKRKRLDTKRLLLVKSLPVSPRLSLYFGL